MTGVHNLQRLPDPTLMDKAQRWGGVGWGGVGAGETCHCQIQGSNLQVLNKLLLPLSPHSSLLVGSNPKPLGLEKCYYHSAPSPPHTSLLVGSNPKLPALE